jgi:hypothetical protein
MARVWFLRLTLNDGGEPPVVSIDCRDRHRWVARVALAVEYPCDPVLWHRRG